MFEELVTDSHVMNQLIRAGKYENAINGNCQQASYQRGSVPNNVRLFRVLYVWYQLVKMGRFQDALPYGKQLNLQQAPFNILSTDQRNHVMFYMGRMALKLAGQAAGEQNEVTVAAQVSIIKQCFQYLADQKLKKTNAHVTHQAIACRILNIFTAEDRIKERDFDVFARGNVQAKRAVLVKFYELMRWRYETDFTFISSKMKRLIIALAQCERLADRQYGDTPLHIAAI